MSKPPPVNAMASMDLQTIQETIASKSDEVAAMRAHARVLALAEIQRLVESFEIEKGEVNFSKPKSIEFTDGRTVVQAKFSDPVTGTTWSGRGYKPVWLRAYLDAGRSIDDFRIGEGRPATPEPTAEDAEQSAPAPGH